MSNSKIKQPHLDAGVSFDSLKDVDWREQQDLFLQSCSILSNLPKKYLPYTFKRVIRVEPFNELLAFDEPNCSNFLAHAEGEADGKTISIALHIGILKVGGRSHFEHFLRCNNFLRKSAKASGGNKYTLSLIIHTGFPKKKMAFFCNECVIVKLGLCICQGSQKQNAEEEIIKGFPNVPFIFLNVKRFTELYQSPKLNLFEKPLQQFLLMLGDFESFFILYATENSFKDIDEDLLPIANHLRERYRKHCKGRKVLKSEEESILSDPEIQALFKRIREVTKAGH